MNVKKRTPRTDMQFDTLIRKMADFWDELVTQEGVPEPVVDRHLTRFAELSCRIDVNGDKIDFEFASFTDEPEVIKAKFLRYLESNSMPWIDDARIAVLRADKPVDPETAPTPPAPAEKKR